MTTEEQPFSDMANFDGVAHRIVSSWDFEWSPFWETYTTPSLVTARALQIFLFGDSLHAWQIFQALFTFGALLWLAYELMQVTNAKWLSIALLLIVSLSKPSIFWSLKLSREGFHEMLIYAQIAAFLMSCRILSWKTFFLLGLISSISFLNKPNVILTLPFLFLMIVLVNWKMHEWKTTFINVLVAVMSCLIGVSILWIPWIARSMAIYGEPVLLSTQGPYTFMWELGDIKVFLDDGTEVNTSVNELQKNASRDFPNDLVASKYANTIAQAWMRENSDQIPQMMMTRIQRSLYDRQIYLTKVSRQELFDNVTNQILLDKSTLTLYLGITGLFLLAAVYRRWILLAIPIIILIPWLSAAMFVGYPRMLEAAIPMILFANLAWLPLMHKGLQHLLSIRN